MALHCCHHHPWLCAHIPSNNPSCHKYTLHSAQVEAPPQGKETQVHSGLEAEPKHLLPQPRHVGCGKHIPANQPAGPLSSALLSTTSKHTLEAQPQAGLQQQFADSIAKAHLLQTKEEVAGTGFSCRKHALGLPLSSRGRVKKIKRESLPEATQPQSGKRQ